MPQLPNAQGVCRQILTGSYAGQPWAAVQYGTYVGPQGLSNSEAEIIAIGIRNSWNTNMAPVCSTQVSLTKVVVQDLITPAGAVGLTTNAAAGTRAGAILPLNVAACVSWLIQARYRGGHPRTYWPAGVAADVDATGRLWTTAFDTSMEAASAGYITALNTIVVPGGTYKFSAVSWYKGYTLDGKGNRIPTPRPTPLIFPVLQANFHKRVDTMRRRLGKEVA